MLVGLWKPVFSSKLTKPCAGTTVPGGIIHLVRFDGPASSLRYHPALNVNGVPPRLCSSSQSLESSFGGGATSVWATTSLMTMTSVGAGSAAPGEPLRNVLARQLPP